MNNGFNERKVLFKELLTTENNESLKSIDSDDELLENSKTMVQLNPHKFFSKGFGAIHPCSASPHRRPVCEPDEMTINLNTLRKETNQTYSGVLNVRPKVQDINNRYLSDTPTDLVQKSPNKQSLV